MRVAVPGLCADFYETLFPSNNPTENITGVVDLLCIIVGKLKIKLL
jgi:hypothetical protein